MAPTQSHAIDIERRTFRFGGLSAWWAFLRALRVFLIVMGCLAYPQAQAHAQSQAQPEALAGALPTFDLDGMVFEADEMQREGKDGVVQLKGNVILQDDRNRLRADRLLLDPQARQARAEGNVRIESKAVAGDARITATAESLSLDQTTAGLLLDGLALRLRQEAILAASQMSVHNGEIALDHVAYTACEAPCDIDDYRQRDPMPWRLTARRAVIDQRTDTLRLQGVTLRLFDLPVLALPALSLPSPEVDRKTGLLAPVAGFRSGRGGFFGIPAYLVLGPSADTTLTPIIFTDGQVRLDSELRLALEALTLTGTASTDTTGALGGRITGALDLLDSSAADTPGQRLQLDLDWIEELNPGQWQALDQTSEDLQLNQLGLSGAWGHSYTDVRVMQDQILLSPSSVADGEDENDSVWLRGWDEGIATRGRIDLRLPPLPGGGRLRAKGQGLIWYELGLFDASLGYSGPLITPGGLMLSPQVQAGAVGEAGSGNLSPWLGGQMKATLPMARAGRYNVASLTPSLALTGLSPADLSDTGAVSPLSPAADVLNRASLFDLRPGSDPFSHAGDVRLDAALDFALYPSSQQSDLGIRGSLGQRVSWTDAALSPTLATLTVDTGGLQLDLRSQINAGFALEHGHWTEALPRFAADLRLPLSEQIVLRGHYARVHDGRDRVEVNNMSLDLNITDKLSTLWSVSARSLAVPVESFGAQPLDADKRNSLRLRGEVSWNFTGDWVSEVGISQSVLNPVDQDLWFDVFHRCACLTAQAGLLRERDAGGSHYSARVALSLPTLFTGDLKTPTLFRHQ